MRMIKIRCRWSGGRTLRKSQAIYYGCVLRTRISVRLPTTGTKQNFGVEPSHRQSRCSRFDPTSGSEPSQRQSRCGRSDPTSGSEPSQRQSRCSRFDPTSGSEPSQRQSRCGRSDPTTTGTTQKKAEALASALRGAGGRGRTDTVSLPLDFESSTSANSITPAYESVAPIHTQ